MADIISTVAGALSKEDSTKSIEDVIHKLVSRRQFLKGAGTVLGATTFVLMGCSSGGGNKDTAASETRQVFTANAVGMIISEPSRCGGCRRCELACTDFNDGKSQPSISRIKVGRNYNWGPVAVGSGMTKQAGIWGNFLTVQDTCRQCPHPVSCQLACPQGAIEVIAPLNARVVNVDNCVGCGICTQACPWDMMSLDRVARKATKCTLCRECVDACPTGALKYVPWSDKTKLIPQRVVVPAYINSAVAASCAKCH